MDDHFPCIIDHVGENRRLSCGLITVFCSDVGAFVAGNVFVVCIYQVNPFPGGLLVA